MTPLLLIMISIYIFFSAILICLLGTYMIEIKYLRYIRGERKTKVRDIDVILVSILFGAPVVLVMELCFKEIRIEDSVHKYRMLISSIILSMIQIVVIVLLFYFGVIQLAGNEEVATSLNVVGLFKLV